MPNYTRIVISPRIRSGRLALATLLHEVIHTAVPFSRRDHGKEFVCIARRLGFVSPFSEINVSPALLLRLREIQRKLGPYPR